MNEPVVKYRFLFKDCSKTGWIQKVFLYKNYVRRAEGSMDCIILIVGKSVTKEKFSPFHIVTLSCLIDFFKKRGYLVALQIENEELKNFVHEDINLTLYWRNKADHIDSPDPTRLNLWRVVKGKAEEYEMSVHQYFSNKFPDTDFFMLKSCLTELYFNIFDHAQADGIAYSYIHYDEKEDTIHIAICDFGKGIAKTIREAYPAVDNDMEALSMSLKKGVSAKSNMHNAGFGLDNVVSALSEDSTLRIVSNNAILFCVKRNNLVETKLFSLPFYFGGTLIYFDLPINGFEKTEIAEEFSF